MIKTLTKKTAFIEIFVYSLIVISWIIAKNILNFNLPYEYLVDLIILGGLITLIILRNSSPRFYWYGFNCLIVSAITSVFNLYQATFFASSLSFGFFAVGMVNTLLFDGKKLRHK